MYDLSDRKIERARAKERRYGLNDGGGLWLMVSPAGKKTWTLFYRKDGKPRQAAIGEYPAMPLKEAREELLQAKRKISEGLDPAKTVQGSEPTFYDAAKIWHEDWCTTKCQKTELGVWALLRNHVFSKIGSLTLKQLTIDHFEDIAIHLQAIGQHATARYVLIYCKKIFRYKPVRKWCPHNPVHSIKAGDLLNRYEIKNRARLPEHDIPELIQKIDAFPEIGARFAMQLMLHFWVRTNELLAAKWEEFDFYLKVWTVPKERMKMRREHLVPLSRQAIEILHDLKVVVDAGEWLFFDGGQVDKNLILYALWDMGYKGRMTGHGFRGVASTRLSKAQIDKRVIETQLSHLDQNRSAAAYDSADHLEARIVMMQHWSDYIDTLRI